MAKFKMKFEDKIFDFITIECEKQKALTNYISITLRVGNSYKTINLDKSTSIKFAKTLRTEINKITESEVSNG